MSINATTGVVSGTPTQTGTFNVGGVFVTDQLGRTSGKAFSMLIQATFAGASSFTAQIPIPDNMAQI